MHNVFVYGSLKRGYQYHCLLQNLPRYKAIAPDITLHAGPDYPFAIRGTGQAMGELYRIDTTLLKRLDELEAHPNDYCRELTRVVLTDTQQNMPAWIYLHPKARCYSLITNGCW